MEEREPGQAVEVVGDMLGELDAAKRREWKRVVWESSRGRCMNCGGEHKIRVQMVVPLEAGGRYEASNGVVVCRACDLAASAVTGMRGQVNRPVNFWVSRRLYDRSKEINGFRSTGELVRLLMDRYVTDPAAFDDLEQYQDGGGDVKINVWVERVRYEKFREALGGRISVTDALKALIMVYESEAEPKIELAARKQETQS